ncbi:MAG: DegV family protein [Candidatus Margulisiibacteriota bacterium]|nr:DegV family protein [Candidatus Margulisiibacteriota bacterium]
MSDFDRMMNNEIKSHNSINNLNLDSKKVSKDQNVKEESMKKFQELQMLKITKPEQFKFPEALKAINLLKSQHVPEINLDILNMVMSLNFSILDGVLNELLIVLGSELRGDANFDFSFLNALVKRLDEAIKDSPKREIYSKALKAVLEKSNVNDPTVKNTIKSILQGINSLDATQTLDLDLPTPVAKNNTNQSATPAVPNSANVDVLGASNMMQLPGMDGLDNLVFERNTIKTKDEAIKIQKTPQNGVIADIELHKDDRVVGHAKAFGTLNNIDLQRAMNPYISAIIQIANIQPLFFISSVASQMLVQMGRLVDDPNLYKVAIVTDNVAALREIDPVDYIRKVQVSDQPQYAIYEKYKQLYEEGYHYIISLHLNPNLKKTYRGAMEAKKQIDEQNINDLEINVYNTNANGVGLGLMIYELVEAIKNNYSPLEVNKLAEQLVKNYRHWVCPLEFDFVKNHQWVMDLADTQKKVQMRLFHFIPVIELDRKLTIINVSYTKEAAFATMMNIIEEIINSKQQKINRICVEYRGVFREAIKMRNQIKVKCPTAKVSLQSVGSLTTQFFGPELVGICII